MFTQTIFTIVVLFLTLRWLLRKFKVGNYGNKYVFITGCDSGFGNLLAKRLDELGCQVFAACLTDKGSKKLKTECSERLSTLLLDVSDENSIHNARVHVESLLPKDKGLWAIVNNAGIGGPVGPLEWSKVEALRKTIDINMFGVMLVTKEFLSLVKRERGRIVNMASVAGRLGLGICPAYIASKFGVEGFSDSLRRELYRTGVSVHIIEPGFFRTAIFDFAGVDGVIQTSFQNAPTDVQRYYGQPFVDKLVEKCKLFFQLIDDDVSQVIDAYEHAITAKYPKVRYLVGRGQILIYQVLWNLPEWLCDFIGCLQDPTPDGAKQINY